MNAAEIRDLYGSARNRTAMIDAIEAMSPRPSGILFIPQPVEGPESDRFVELLMDQMKKPLNTGGIVPKIVVGPTWHADDLPWTHPIADLTPEERDARGQAIIDQLEQLDTTQPPVSGWPVVYGPHPPRKKKGWWKRHLPRRLR